MDIFQKLIPLMGMASMVTMVIFSSTMVAEGVMDHQSSEQTEFSEWNTALLVLKCALIALIFVVLVVLNCTDCYNSEVSTECHPAAAGTGSKWGGAGGYTSAASSDVNRSVMGSGFAAEVVHPDDVAPLPYALIPAQVPESQGFRGYGPAQPEGAPLMGGYSSSGVPQSAPTGYGGTIGVPQSSLTGYGASSGVQYGASSGVTQPSQAGYGGIGGVPQASLAGYAARGGTQPPNLTCYGGAGGEQWGGQGGVGGASQWGGSNPVRGRAQYLPGAHVPLMTPESEDPPPPTSHPTACSSVLINPFTPSLSHSRFLQDGWRP